MMGDGNYKWWFARSEDDEYWSGPEATREAAIQAGTTDYEGEPFAIFEADRSVCRAAFNADFIAERIVEGLGENNEECWSEDGWDDAWAPDAIRDLERTVEAAVADWLKRFPAKTWAAGDIRVTEVITPTLARIDGEGTEA